jgi:hypothetical protein
MPTLDDRPHPLPVLVCAVDNGRFSLASARNGGTHLFWANNDGALSGAIATLLNVMRGLPRAWDR